MLSEIISFNITHHQNPLVHNFPSSLSKPCGGRLEQSKEKGGFERTYKASTIMEALKVTKSNGQQQ